SNGEVFVAGYTESSDFPGTAGGAQTQPDSMFVARLNSSLTTLLQATYLGGSGADNPLALAINQDSGEVYLEGNTQSADFPHTAGGAQPTYAGCPQGCGDAFVARLSPTLETLDQSTYLGGTGTEYSPDGDLKIDPVSGDVLIVGTTD